MSNDQDEAIFHAAKLLQLYEETESVEAVTEAAAALLAKRPSDHVREVAWFLPPELIRVLPKTTPRPHRPAATSVEFVVSGPRCCWLSRDRTPEGRRKPAATVNRQVPHCHVRRVAWFRRSRQRGLPRCKREHGYA
jgi:hypothetical protein